MVTCVNNNYQQRPALLCSYHTLLPTVKDMDLVGVAEIREMLGGISRQRVSIIANSKGFPDPVAVLAMGKVWRRRDVARWIAEHRPNQD